MKKTGIIALVIFTIIACNSNSEKKPETKEEASAEKTTDNSSNPDYQKGLSLVAGSDCFTCHKVEDRIVGPTYREVADKYAGASQEEIANLAQKIIKGGSGVWGEQIMTPHPQISQEDAEAMVKYILLLKK